MVKKKKLSLSTAKPLAFIDVSDVDWKLLREQKNFLIKIIANLDVHGDPWTGKRCPKAVGCGEGLLSLLDHIQDEAAEQLDEKTVFGRLT